MAVQSIPATAWARLLLLVLALLHHSPVQEAAAQTTAQVNTSALIASVVEVSAAWEVLPPLGSLNITKDVAWIGTSALARLDFGRLNQTLVMQAGVTLSITGVVLSGVDLTTTYAVPSTSRRRFQSARSSSWAAPRAAWSSSQELTAAVAGATAAAKANVLPELPWLPTFLALGGPGTLLLLQDVTMDVTCGTMTLYQATSCDLMPTSSFEVLDDSLHGVRVVDVTVPIVAMGSSVSFNNVTLRCSSRAFLPPPCLATTVSDGAALLDAIQAMADSDRPQGYVMVTNSTVLPPAAANSTALSVRNSITVARAVTVKQLQFVDQLQPDSSSAGIKGPTPVVGLGFGNRTDVWAIDGVGSLTFHNLVLHGLPVGSASSYPHGLLTLLFWPVTFPRNATAQSPPLLLSSCSVLLPRDELDYWAALAQRDAQRTSIDVLVVNNNVSASGTPIVNSTAILVGSWTMAAGGAQLVNTAVTTQPPGGVGSAGFDSTGTGIGALKAYGQVGATSLSNVQPVSGPLAPAALAKSPYLLVSGSASLPYASFQSQAISFAAGSAVILGDPWGRAVLDLQRVSFGITSTPPARVTLKSLVLINPGQVPVAHPGIFSPGFNFTFLLWAIRGTLSGSISLEARDVVVVVPQDEFNIIAEVVRTGNCTGNLYSAAVLNFVVALFTSNGTRASLDTNSTLVVQEAVWAGMSVSNMTLTYEPEPGFATLPLLYPIIYPKAPPAPPFPKFPKGAKEEPSSGLAGWAIAVIVVCTVVPAAGLMVFTFVVLRRRRSRQQRRRAIASGEGQRSWASLLLRKSLSSVSTVREAMVPRNESSMARDLSSPTATVPPREGSARTLTVATVSTGTTAASGHTTAGSGASEMVPLVQRPDTELQRALTTFQSEIGDQQVTIQAQLGAGAQGVVYRGQWRGLTVAVKTLLFQAFPGTHDNASYREKALTEAAIATTLYHPYVVNTYSYEMRPLVKGPAPGSCGRQAVVDESAVMDWKLYIIQEHCDQGALKEWLEAGKMHEASPPLQQPPEQLALPLSSDLQPENLPQHEPRLSPTAMQLALQVGCGMHYIHSKNIIHGDLKPGNILLKTDVASPSSVLAKITDFGLSLRMGAHETHVSNIRRGTPLYMAPELVHDGRATKASDVYAFGVLMFELFHGTTVARTLPMRKRVPNLPLEYFTLPREAPPAYGLLMRACLDPVAAKRPSFLEVVQQLLALQAALESQGLAEPLPEAQQAAITAALYGTPAAEDGANGTVSLELVLPHPPPSSATNMTLLQAHTRAEASAGAQPTAQLSLAGGARV